MSLKPFSTPGFQCSFVSEYEAAGEEVTFSLRFLKMHEGLEHLSGGPCLMVSLDAGSASVKNANFEWALGPEAFAVLPAGVASKVTAQSNVLKLARIHYSRDFFRKAAPALGCSVEDLEEAFSRPAQLKRSLWVNEVWNRYIFERSIAREPTSLASRFCELELFKEAFFRVIRPDAFDPTCARQRLGILSAPVEKAVAHIERNLHQPNLDLEGLAAEAGASKSSLQRAFGRELGETPMRYVWKRRLQEARLLLMTGRYGVAEIAIHVGYSDVSSFSQAFQREFGHAPSRTGEG